MFLLIYEMFDLNSTNTSDVRVPPWIQYNTFLTAWFSLINLFSILGAALNLLLFCGIISSRRLRSGSGALIAHSVFIDALVCALANPLMSTSIWAAQYGVPAEIRCRFIVIIFYVLVFTGNWVAVPLAANRFVAICLPHFYDKICHSKPLFVFFVTFSWTVSFACSLLYFFGITGKFESVRPWNGCGQTVIKPQEFGIITAVCTSFPTALQGVAYTSLFAYVYVKKLLRRREITNTALSFEQTGNKLRILALHRRRLRVTKMVFVAYVWSTVCYMSAPVAVSAGPELIKSRPFILLVVAVLLQLGYATSPVSVTEHPFF